MKKVNELSEIRVSFFKAPIFNIEKNKDLSIAEAYQLMKSEEYKEPTSYMRSLHNKNEREKYKREKLDYITFCGAFSKRDRDGLIKPSHLLPIDIDAIGIDVPHVIEVIRNDPKTKNNLVMGYVTPSGEGYRPIYLIDSSLFTQGLYYSAISQYLSILCNVPLSHFDQSCKDVSRASFLCYDENAYLNPEYDSGNITPFIITEDLQELIEKKPQAISTVSPSSDNEEF
jgi:VirE-like protein